MQYRQALKLQPGNPPVELNLALAFYKTGQIEPQPATLEKVHRAAPGGVAARPAAGRLLAEYGREQEGRRAA